MKVKLRKFFILTILFSISAVCYAETARVTYIRGKVEVNRNNSWVTLKIDDIVNDNDTISTGFQSEAKIEYKGSIMCLGAVTRITLEQLSSSESTDNVSVYLKTGAVRSKVTHTDSKRVAYVVKTPIAVASVRGTDFIVTANGRVSCSDGAVAVYANTENRNLRKLSVETEANSEDTAEVEADSSSSETETVAAPKTSEPATSVTPAKEIDTTAPTGAVVVAKNQETTFKVNGNPETPIANTIRKNDTVKNTVNTAASAESVSLGGSGTIAKTITTEAKATLESDVIPIVPNTSSSILVKVQIED